MNLRDVRLVATDVDGVLTDNTFVYGPDGEKYRRWNMADGQAVLMLRRVGVDVLFLTQEESPDIERRAAALGVPCIVGGIDKLDALQRLYLFPREISLANVAYIGNEENDVSVLNAVGNPFTPCDAWISGFGVLQRPGGAGCLRELAEHIIRTAPAKNLLWMAHDAVYAGFPAPDEWQK